MPGIDTDQCADEHDDGAVSMPFHIIHPIHLFSFGIRSYKAMCSVPMPIRIRPAIDLVADLSCRKINADTTFDAPPVWSAL